MSPCTRSALFVACVVAQPACGLIFPDGPACPDLDEVCPDVVCDDYAQNRDGCSICECEGADAPGAVCWDEADCAEGQRCDIVNFCEPAPSCADDGPCPDACYGRCVEAPSSCTSDADCPDGQICSFFANERSDSEEHEGDPGSDPAPGAPQPIPVDSGVCLDLSCGDAEVRLPECPPGSELFFKDDACAAICLPVDRCRELLPEECLAERGCQLVEEGCGCEGTEDVCDCASIERCVAIDDCSSLSVDQCESNANCVLKAIGGGSNGEAEPAPCECEPNVPNCTCEGDGGVPPPPDEVVCVPRGFDGTCLSDADCNFDEICELSTVCGSGCALDDDGEEHCFEECWSERGLCVLSDGTCFELGPDQCLADPRCELVEDSGAPCTCDADDEKCAPCVSATSCRPREGACFGDFDCLDGQHCELSEICPSCDPSSGSDIDCVAPCFVEGSCVDGVPPPVPCTSDAECGIGSTCVSVTVCEACDAGGGGNAPSVPCDPVCRDENLCVQTDPVCFSDLDCGATDFCDLSQLGCAFPGGLVACPGLCVARDEFALCQEDAQCDPGQRCATERDHCLTNADQPDSGCWTVCVNDTAGSGAYCLSDDQCATSTSGMVGGTCAFQADVCLDDPASDLALCSGWCTRGCDAVLTSAIDPSTGQCAEFPDSCIPPGWEAIEGC